MATDTEEERLVALVRSLARQGKTLSIAVESPDAEIIARAKRTRHEFSVTDADGDCVKWIYVPGEGPVCVKHAGG